MYIVSWCNNVCNQVKLHLDFHKSQRIQSHSQVNFWLVTSSGTTYTNFLTSTQKSRQNYQHVSSLIRWLTKSATFTCVVFRIIVPVPSSFVCGSTKKYKTICPQTCNLTHNIIPSSGSFNLILFSWFFTWHLLCPTNDSL